jgi:hypothetical protein
MLSGVFSVPIKDATESGVFTAEEVVEVGCTPTVNVEALVPKLPDYTNSAVLRIPRFHSLY